MLTLLVGADTTLRWNAMDLESTGVYVNDATCTFAVKDASNVAVSGATGTMTYVAASNGNYKGVLNSTVTLVLGATYWLELTAASGAADDFRRIECVAGYHDED